MPKKSKKPAFSVYIAFALCTAAICDNASAQGYFFWNPSDHTLPFSTEINPSLVSKHFTQVAVGLQVYHLGFLQDSDFSLRENRINFSFPYILPYDLALGFDIRYFTAIVYSELAASLLLSREIMKHFSLGVKVALERRGFDSAKFQGVDFSDPLISNGLSFNRFNFGLGAYWQKDNFTIGFGLDHVNQAGIGVADQSATVPMELAGAFGYKLGTITPTLLLHEDGNQLRIGFAIVAQKPTLGTLRIGYEDNLPFRVEASLNLTKNGSLGYGIDLPKAGTRGLSAGSHQLVYQHILGREPELGQPEIFFSTRKLNILEKTVVRSLPACRSARSRPCCSR
ncbi:MAG: type IX secretion system membrane protein PorP/SprF [bacterium]